SLLVRKSSLTLMKEQARSFWFKIKRKPVEYGSGNCGKPAPTRIEPCKGCPSRCLEKGYGEPTEPTEKKLFSCKQGPIKEKPSNCVKEKPIEQKLTLWEEFFGPDPKRSWPDPCTCRIAIHQKRELRKKDPRLLDPRYKNTAGDVLVYTEVLKKCNRICSEPQPKPPPAFRLPKEVLYRMINEGYERVSCNCEIFIRKKVRGVLNRRFETSISKARHISCREGIRTEDVNRLIDKESNVMAVHSTVQQAYSQQGSRMNVSKSPTKIAECPPQVESTAALVNVGRRSRVEQLKILVQAKSAFQCAPAL
ncbi:hypothetical protein WN55_10188, partial [Dufourea novaeangliae]